MFIKGDIQVLLSWQYNFGILYCLDMVVCVVFLPSETVLSSKLLQTSHKMINDIADVHRKTQGISAIITYTVFRQSNVWLNYLAELKLSLL